MRKKTATHVHLVYIHSLMHFDLAKSTIEAIVVRPRELYGTGLLELTQFTIDNIVQSPCIEKFASIEPGLQSLPD